MEAVTVKVLDDIDGPGVATPAVVQNKCFAWDGKIYVIDLGSANLKLVTEFMNGLILNARAIDEMPKRPAGIILNADGMAEVKAPQVQMSYTQKAARTAWLKPRREWAKANGWPELSNYGQIPQEALDAYERAHE